MLSCTGSHRWQGCAIEQMLRMRTKDVQRTITYGREHQGCAKYSVIHVRHVLTAIAPYDSCQRCAEDGSRRLHQGRATPQLALRVCRATGARNVEGAAGGSACCTRGRDPTTRRSTNSHLRPREARTRSGTSEPLPGAAHGDPHGT